MYGHVSVVLPIVNWRGEGTRWGLTGKGELPNPSRARRRTGSSCEFSTFVLHHPQELAMQTDIEETSCTGVPLWLHIVPTP